MLESLRFIWILIKYKAIRQINQTSQWRKFKVGRRTTSSGKNWSSLVSVFIGSYLFAIVWFQTGQTLEKVQKDFSFTHHVETELESPDTLPAEESYTPEKFLTFSYFIKIELLLAFLTCLLSAFFMRETGVESWDLEWLATLPISLTALTLGRILERALLNPLGFVLLLPELLAVSTHFELGAKGIAIVGLCYVFLMLLVGCFHALMDAVLKLSLRPSHVKNISALLSILAVLLMTLSFARIADPYIIQLASKNWQGLNWFPSSLAVDALTSHFKNDIAVRVTMLAVLALGASALTVVILSQLLREGVVMNSAQTSRRVKKALSTSSVRQKQTSSSFFSPVVRKELLLLSRDRTFLAQTLLTPLMVFGLQALLQNKSSNSWLTSPASVGAVAFGVATYSYIFSIFQIIRTEQSSLWLLMSVPTSLTKIILSKVKFWSFIGLTFTLTVFAYKFWTLQKIPFEYLPVMAIAVLGALIYAVIAAALGFFAIDPLSPLGQASLKVSYQYLYMTLGGFFTYALFSQTLWEKLVLTLLCGFTAMSLWQKMRDAIPHLLDPESTAPSRVDLKDGLIGTLAFFVLQGLFMALVMLNQKEIGLGGIAISYSLAGFFVFVTLKWIYYSYDAEENPSFFTGFSWEILGAAMITGLGVGLIGAVYQNSARMYFDLPASPLENVSGMLLLVCIAVPLFEEFLFRGVVLAALLRSWPRTRAIIASALIFTLVHPPFSGAPIFLLGLATSIFFARTKALWPSILIHAIYNAIIALTH